MGLGGRQGWGVQGGSRECLTVGGLGWACREWRAQWVAAQGWWPLEREKTVVGAMGDAPSVFSPSVGAAAMALSSDLLFRMLTKLPCTCAWKLGSSCELLDGGQASCQQCG